MFIIKRSLIHGKGVFAINIVPKGRVFYDTVKVVNGNESSPYAFPWKGQGAICNTFGKYLNHSKTPNCKVIKRDCDNLKIFFECIKYISPNEELVIDYQTKKSLQYE